MRRWARSALWAGVIASALAGAAHAAPPSDGPPLPSLRPTRHDFEFALAAAGATALVASEDRRWLAQATADHSRFALDFAADARRLGEPAYVGGALLATDLAARALHSRRVAAASERIAGAIGAAGAASLVLKELVGRERPDETSDPGRFRPFSAHDAFPSGHTTVAFAAAAALTAETHSRWVAALAFPAATLTAWSRVRDRRHWPSDVVAGAAVGAGLAWRADAYERARWPRGLPFVLTPGVGGGALAMSARF